MLISSWDGVALLNVIEDTKALWNSKDAVAADMTSSNSADRALTANRDMTACAKKS